MCYAFTSRMQGESLPAAAEERRSQSSNGRASIVQAEAKDASQSRKRSASSFLEHGHAKVAKSLGGSAKSHEGSVVSATKASGEKGKSYEKLEQEHNDLRQRANKMFRALRAEKKEVEEERDDLRGRAAELEDELEQVQKKLKSKGSDGSKQVAKRIEEDIKKKYEKKMSDAQAKYEQNLSQKLASKVTKLQRKIEDLREKREDAEEEAKQVKVDFAQQEKARKTEHDELKKELRAEKHAEIKQFKAENSSEVKEKKDLIKSYQNQIESIKKDTKVAGNEMGELQHQVKKLTEYRRSASQRIKALEETIQQKTEFTFGLGREYAAKTQELEAKLALEAKRWRKQKDCCNELSQKLMAQQRENFVLRNNNQGGVEQLEALMARMKKKRESGPSGEAVSREGGGDQDAAGCQQEGAVAGQTTREDTSMIDVEQHERMLDLLTAGDETPEAAGNSIFGVDVTAAAAGEAPETSNTGRDSSASDARVDTPAAEGISHSSSKTVVQDATSSSAKGKHFAATPMPTEKAEGSTEGPAVSTQGKLESSTAAVTEDGAVATKERRDYGSGWFAMSAQATDGSRAHGDHKNASVSKSRRVNGD